jgi:hypothetical protein
MSVSRQTVSLPWHKLKSSGGAESLFPATATVKSGVRE